MQEENNIYEEIAIRHALVDEHAPVPDVEAELARFHAEHAGEEAYRRIGRGVILRYVASFVLGMAAMLACVFLYKPVARMLMNSNISHSELLANADVSIVAEGGEVYVIGSKADEEKLLDDYGITVYPDGKIAMPSIGRDNVKDVKLTIATKRQKECHVLMSDGSEVWMNGDTKIDLHTLFAEGKRDVHLAGEAFFRVAKDESRVFSVYTEKTVTRVTGTEFFVQCYPGEESVVTLVKGSVVTSNLITNDVTQLVPGERMKVDLDGKQSVDKTTNLNYAEPMSEYFCFDNESVATIVREIARWYGYGVRVENDDNAAIMLYFEAKKDGDISDAVSLLNGLSSAKVEIEGEILVIK